MCSRIVFIYKGNCYFSLIEQGFITCNVDTVPMFGFERPSSVCKCRSR